MREVTRQSTELIDDDRKNRLSPRMLTIAIMQPYFFPYLGYFQLMAAADKFVIYDNVQYIKQGWINRNRILANGKTIYLSIPLKKGPSYYNINDRHLSDVWSKYRKHVLVKISECDGKAPHFKEVYTLIEQCLTCEDRDLLGFVLNSLNVVKEYLHIRTPFVISSTINIDHSMKGENKVIEICKALGATNYLNPIGGEELYRKDQFEKAGIQLNFLKPGIVQYAQFRNEFVPFLSIIDVMMFNDKDTIKKYLNFAFITE